MKFLTFEELTPRLRETIVEATGQLNRRAFPDNAIPLTFTVAIRGEIPNCTEPDLSLPVPVLKAHFKRERLISRNRARFIFDYLVA